MSTVLEQIQYGFDRNSRRTWQRRSLTDTQDQRYGYDSLGQVSSAACGSLNVNLTAISGRPADVQSWEYDPTGNWRGYHVAANGMTTLDQHRVHDRGNRLTQIEGNPSNMILDRVGRMRQMAPDADGDWDGKLEITWDAWSRVTRVRNNGTEVGSYGYDGRHRRIMREVDSTTLHSYYNDVWRPVEERKDSAATAAMSYLWGTRHRDDLVRRDRAVGGTTLNERHYVLMDYFNPAAITDETGEVKERYAFSAFGVRSVLNPSFTVRSSSECEMEFAFQGQFLDGESGLMNYGYRYYSPQLGRWTCKDPIGERGGFNLYGVVENDPVNKVDHLGLLDVEFKPGQPENAPVVDDGTVKCQTYSPACTTYDREISCTCSGEKKCTVKCKVVLNPTIHMRWDWIGFGLEKTRIGLRKVQVSAGEAYGHEQRHILDRIKRVTEHVVDPLRREKSEFSTPNTCAINAETYKNKYKSTLETQLTYNSTGWHDWDPKTIVPGEAEPLPPLPGSTTVPNDVPFPTQENTD